jgi:hypothetical protein
MEWPRNYRIEIFPVTFRSMPRLDHIYTLQKETRMSVLLEWSHHAKTARSADGGNTKRKSPMRVHPTVRRFGSLVQFVSDGTELCLISNMRKYGKRWLFLLKTYDGRMLLLRRKDRWRCSGGGEIRFRSVTQGILSYLECSCFLTADEKFRP